MHSLQAPKYYKGEEIRLTLPRQSFNLASTIWAASANELVEIPRACEIRFIPKFAEVYYIYSLSTEFTRITWFEVVEPVLYKGNSHESCTWFLTSSYFH